MTFVSVRGEPCKVRGTTRFSGISMKKRNARTHPVRAGLSQKGTSDTGHRRTAGTLPIPFLCHGRTRRRLLACISEAQCVRGAAQRGVPTPGTDPAWGCSVRLKALTECLLSVGLSGVRTGSFHSFCFDWVLLYHVFVGLSRGKGISAAHSTAANASLISSSFFSAFFSNFSYMETKSVFLLR